MALEDSANFELGPCQALYGTAGSEATIGYTLDGFNAEIMTDSVDLKADQLGSQPAGKVIIGRGATVKGNLAEPTLANIYTQMPGTLLVTDAMSATKQKVLVKQSIGTDLYDLALSLLLKKYVSGAVSSARADWIRFPKAAPVTAVMLPFDLKTQRVLAVEFFCFPDTSFTPSGVVAVIGDETAAS